MSYLDSLRAQLVIDEGWKKMPYKDTGGKISIGVGRNLTDVGLSGDEIEVMLTNDIVRAVSAAQNLFSNFQSLSDNRKVVLANMAFNLGQAGLGKFHTLISCVLASDWEGAANAMMSSAWAIQVGKRAERLAKLMRSG